MNTGLTAMFYGTPGTGKTESALNAMQNIILEEMEKFKEILIAISNLVGNLDQAFERRFIFKIRLETPPV